MQSLAPDFSANKYTHFAVEYPLSHMVDGMFIVIVLP